MKKHLIIISVIIFSSLLFHGCGRSSNKCTGDSDCDVCTDCSRCEYCNTADERTCGVCGDGNATFVEP